MHGLALVWFATPLASEGAPFELVTSFLNEPLPPGN